MKRQVAALLAAMLLLAACGTEAETEETMAETEVVESAVSVEEKAKELAVLTLACGRDFGDTHPSKWEDASEALVPLLYESLVTVDESYHWQPQLAESIEKDGLTYTITLKEAVFSDGSTVKASDVVSSLEAAKESGSQWERELSVVEECSALSAGTIRIVLNQQRQDFENLLTFPVAKLNSGGVYLGSGPYCLPEDGDGTELIQNPNYSGGKGPESIQLLELPNSDMLRDCLRIGKINCLYDDLSGGEAMNLSEENQAVELGNLLFLGVNCESGMMAQAEMRQAVSGAVNRQVLADRVYASKATVTTTPFHPNYYQIADYKAAEYSLEDVKALLESAGLKQNQEGYYCSEEQERLILLYNSENSYRPQTAELLRQQLATVGLDVELKGLPYEEYMAALKEGSFDLYLGELAIDASMDIRRLLNRGENYGFGISGESSGATVYEAFQQGTASAELFLTVFEKNMPTIPLLYRQGIIVYGSGVEAGFAPSGGKAFDGIYQE